MSVLERDLRRREAADALVRTLRERTALDECTRTLGAGSRLWESVHRVRERAYGEYKRARDRYRELHGHESGGS